MSDLIETPTENSLLRPRLDSEVALRNAIRLWAEQTTRPETNERDSKLGDKTASRQPLLRLCGQAPWRK